MRIRRKITRFLAPVANRIGARTSDRTVQIASFIVILFGVAATIIALAFVANSFWLFILYYGLVGLLTMLFFPLVQFVMDCLMCMRTSIRDPENDWREEMLVRHSGRFDGHTVNSYVWMCVAITGLWPLVALTPRDYPTHAQMLERDIEASQP